MKILLLISFLIVGCTGTKEEAAQKRIKMPYKPTPHPNRLIKRKKYPRKYSEECMKHHEAWRDDCEAEREARSNARSYNPNHKQVVRHSCGIKRGAMYKGCQGEACFCGRTPTDKPEATKEVKVYSMPSVKSEVIHTLQKGDAIEKAEPYMYVARFGEAQIHGVKFGTSFRGGQKKYANGNRVTLLYYAGEGYYAVCEDPMDKPVFTDKLKIISKPGITRWMNVTLLDGRKGWTLHWNFNYLQEGCG